MSWPDNWTALGKSGKRLADGPRYRLIGNGVVTNVAEWLARRLMFVMTAEKSPTGLPTALAK